MGIADLTGVRAKLGRADEHLQAFDSEMRRCMERDPEAGRVQLWYEAPWYIVRFKPFPPFPLHTALVLGDCIHNIRTALDHLVWQLVLREDQKPGERLCFPIYEVDQEFSKKVELPSQRSNKRAPLYGIPLNGEAWAIIKGAQPFLSSEPQRHPLSVLSRLNDVDKHRTVLVQHALVDVQQLVSLLRWVPDLQPVEQRISVPFPSGEEPAELARFRFAGNENMSMQMDRYGVGEPMVGDGETYVSTGILTVARLYVETILNQVSALPGVQG